MTWQSVDRQQDLDDLDRSVTWDDTDLLEIHGGSGPRPYFPSETNRRGLVALNYHVLLWAVGSKSPILELAFVECDEFNPAVFRVGLKGRVTTLMQVEIGRYSKVFDAAACSTGGCRRVSLESPATGLMMWGNPTSPWSRRAPQRRSRLKGKDVMRTIL